MGVPAHSRVVEVLQLVRSAESNTSHWELGSGYLIGGRRVLTASHVVQSGEILVRRVDEESVVKDEWSAELELRGDPEVADFAVLTLLDGPVEMPPATFARVDVDSEIAEVIERCMAIGFAQYMNENGVAGAIKRRMTHVYGEIPALHAFGDGLLTLYVARPPKIVQAQLDAGISPFKGMSGAAVTVSGELIGVIRHHPANEAGSLAVSPLTLLGKLDDEARVRWKAALGTDPRLLPTLSAPRAQTAVHVLPTATPRLSKQNRAEGRTTALVLPDFQKLSRSSATAEPPEADILSLMIRDVEWMRDTYTLKPDLVLVPGGLVRSPTPSAYRDARLTLDRLCSALGLPPDRIVVAPGAHDVNPRRYEDFVEDARAAGTTAQPPYAAKWDYIFAMLDELCGPASSGRLTREQPWAWREFAAQKLAVAVLNTTMYDTGKSDGHRGRLGEAQLEQFAGAAAVRAAEGWLCLGLLYDAPISDDEPSLVDAAAFLQRIGVHLTLVVHGRPRSYVDRVTTLGLTTVIGATHHPDGSYQILDLGPQSRIWARLYDPYRGEWTADTDVGAQPNTWSRRL